MLLALAERLNPTSWTDADQITTGLQQATEALERLAHVFAKRRRRGRKKPRSGSDTGGSAATSGEAVTESDASDEPDGTEPPDNDESSPL